MHYWHTVSVTPNCMYYNNTDYWHTLSLPCYIQPTRMVCLIDTHCHCHTKLSTTIWIIDTHCHCHTTFSQLECHALLMHIVTVTPHCVPTTRVSLLTHTLTVTPNWVCYNNIDYWHTVTVTRHSVRGVILSFGAILLAIEPHYYLLSPCYE